MWYVSCTQVPENYLLLATTDFSYFSDGMNHYTHSQIGYLIIYTWLPDGHMPMELQLNLVKCFVTKMEFHLEMGGVSLLMGCPFICSTFYFFVGARAAENSEIEVKLVHIFTVLLCRGQEQVKSVVSVLSFSFQRINLSFLVVWTWSFSCQLFPLHVSSPPDFSSFLFVSTRSICFKFQPCPFASTLSFCFQLFPCSFQPRSFRLNPALSFQPCPFCRKS